MTFLYQTLVSRLRPQWTANSAHSVGTRAGRFECLLAGILLSKGQVQPALSEYQRVLSGAPDSARANFGLGAALAMPGDREGAIRHLRRAVASGDAAVRERAAALLREVERGR